MLPENLKWEFPDSVDQAVRLISKPGTILHAGGTRILKTYSGSVKCLVDTGNLNLNYINFIDNAFYIGASVTFAEVIRYSRGTGKLGLLSKALSGAASTPLKNRITVGGSLKDFPLWSSLYAPLIALDARIEIAGEHSGIYPIEDYVQNGIIKTRHLIKHVIVDETDNVVSGVKRFSLLKFEYPLFTIAALLRNEDGKIKEARLVITGVKGRFKRFRKAEKIFEGKNLEELTIRKALALIKPRFVSDFKYSSEYKEKVAGIYFMDLLNELKEGAI
ncbi:MAG: FAD binding domain-containing protein [Ignavibacteriales bacterium]